jgi:hypothetical protein
MRKKIVNVASAGVPPSVVSSTISAATLSAAGPAAAAAVISPKVDALTERVLKVMVMSKLNAAGAFVLVLGFMVVGATVLTHRTAAAQGDRPTAASDKRPTAEERVSDASPATEKKEKQRDPRQTVEAYLAASVAGKKDEAAALAIPNQKPPSKQRAEGLKELDGKKAIALVSVLASENSGRATAISEFIQLKKPNFDGQEKGCLVISLNKEEGGWLIRDLDLTSEDGAKGRVADFARRHPDAKEVPGKER